MSKSALQGLVKGLARDLGPRGITINNVQPGPVDTNMNPASGEFAEALKSSWHFRGMRSRRSRVWSPTLRVLRLVSLRGKPDDRRRIQRVIRGANLDPVHLCYLGAEAFSQMKAMCFDDSVPKRALIPCETAIPVPGSGERRKSRICWMEASSSHSSVVCCRWSKLPPPTSGPRSAETAVESW